MLVTPTSAYIWIISRSSAIVCPTAVRWAMGTRSVSLTTLSTTLTVRSRVDPPAP